MSVITNESGNAIGVTANPMVVSLSAGGLPSGAVAVTASSATMANSAASATLPGVASKTTYISGFELTAGGATAGQCVSVTVTGTISGTLTYTFCSPTGAAVYATPLLVSFDPPIPANAVNTAIIVNLPALGAGNLFANAVAHGFQI